MNTANDLLWRAPQDRIKALAIAIFPAWFLIALALSLLGAFESGHAPPLALGAAASLPVLAFVTIYLKWPAFREAVLAVNLHFLTLAQAWRVAAVTFLILYYRGILPGAFALPAGWGDIAVGVTAPLMAWAVSSRKVFPRRTFIVWNVLGLADLVTAVTLGVLSSPSPLGILAGDVTTAPMGRFPLSLIPTFFVPALAILHLISLANVWQRRGRS